MSDVLLIECELRGLVHHVSRADVELLRKGMPLDMIREPQNPYDKHAIRIEYGYKKYGYVPRENSQIVAALIDGGFQVRAEVGLLIDPRRPLVTIRILIKK